MLIYELVIALKKIMRCDSDLFLINKLIFPKKKITIDINVLVLLHHYVALFHCFLTLKSLRIK